MNHIRIFGRGLLRIGLVLGLIVTIISPFLFIGYLAEHDKSAAVFSVVVAIFLVIIYGMGI